MFALWLTNGAAAPRLLRDRNTQPKINRQSARWSCAPLFGHTPPRDCFNVRLKATALAAKENPSIFRVQQELAREAAFPMDPNNGRQDRP
jgi:hypothetical protein